MKNKALVVAAHPDDEVLGCGATIARLVDGGWEVHVLIMAEGATSRMEERNRDLCLNELSDLAKAAKVANQILGSSSLTLVDLPDNRMDGLELLDVVKRIEIEIQRLSPQKVFTHFAGDVNVDHQVLHQAVVTACRPLPGHPVRDLLFFEVASSTEWRPPAASQNFSPNCFYDISGHLARKLDALKAYASELRPFPHPRSIEAVEHLARWRGATVGCNAAEAFMLGRSLI